MTHREAIREWLSGIKLKNKTVIDWGSGSKPAFRYIGYDKGNYWTTIDNADNIPDDRKRHHLNHDITEPIQVIDADVAFCLEVLEHVKDPVYLLLSIWGNLRFGGKLYLSVPFRYKKHGDSDYWRFTDDGIRLLLENAGFKVESVRETTDELGFMVEATK